MSRRYTTITLPSCFGAGYMQEGRQAPVHMIHDLRTYWVGQLEIALAVAAAKDEDFKIETHLGSSLKRNREIIQQGKTKP